MAESEFSQGPAVSQTRRGDARRFLGQPKTSSEVGVKNNFDFEVEVEDNDDQAAE